MPLDNIVSVKIPHAYETIFLRMIVSYWNITLFLANQIFQNKNRGLAIQAFLVGVCFVVSLGSFYFNDENLHSNDVASQWILLPLRKLNAKLNK